MGRLKPCQQPGCPANVLDGRYCPKHITSNQVKEYDKNRDRNDPARRLYWKGNYRGPNGFQKFLMAKNPQCQKLELVNGVLVQCLEFSTVLHHLRDPKDAPTLFLTASNAACVCENHHPGGTAGTPNWRTAQPGEPGHPNVEYYVPTVASHSL
jgi:hypothetical protein